MESSEVNLTQVTPRRQEFKDPVVEFAKDLDEKLSGLFKGIATYQSKVRRVNGGQMPIMRTPGNRARRAETLEKLSEGAITKQGAVEFGHTIDEVDRQFLFQGTLKVNMPGLGTQEARYTIIDINPEVRDKQGPPIFVVPAISGDLTGVQPLMREAALFGKKLISVGYPDSYMGKVTSAFVKKAEESKDFEPHTTFFKMAIDHFMRESGEFEIWGYSTGGGLIADILRDPKYQKRARNAVLFAPGGSTKQTLLEFVTKSVPNELNAIKKEMPNIQDVGVALWKRAPIDKGQGRLRNKAFLALLKKKVLREFPYWNDVKVKEGGKVIVVTGGRDLMTRAFERNSKFLENPQFVVLNDPDGHHVTPLFEAEYTIRKVLEVENKALQDIQNRIIGI